MKLKANKSLVKWSFTLLTIFTGSLFTSCESVDLDQQVDPSRLTVDQLDPDALLTAIQLKLAEFFDSGTTDNNIGMNEFGMQVTRMNAMITGTSYENAFQQVSMNGVYSDAYEDAVADVRALVPLAEESGLFTHLGMAQVMEAYIVMTLVDYFGDIPYSEAFQGAANLAPNLDLGEDVYVAVEDLLDEASENFNKEETASVTSDFYYDGDESNWIKLANTLKLKMYVQTKLVDNDIAFKINEIISTGDFIQTADEDFQFNYSSNDVNPDSRHPLFNGNFDDGKNDYMGNDYMNMVVNQEDVDGNFIDDPRRRYYFYRQDLNFSAADIQTLPCINEDKPSHYSDEDPFCQVVSSFGSGYWGRDHGDSDGIPPDDARVVLFGVYPVGGPFDDDSGNTISNRNTGLLGAGSSMIMLSSYVQFMLSETSLTNGVSGDPRSYLEQGVRQSISKVMNFGSSIANLSELAVEDDIDTVEDESMTFEEDFNLTAEDVDLYVGAILAKYDAATNDDERLDIIIEQYFLALFNNGVEAYNTYRRTGKPDLQPTLIPAPGIFMRTFPYPDALVTRNINADTKPISTQVFWDTNPATFID